MPTDQTDRATVTERDWKLINEFMDADVQDEDLSILAQHVAAYRESCCAEAVREERMNTLHTQAKFIDLYEPLLAEERERRRAEQRIKELAKALTGIKRCLERSGDVPLPSATWIAEATRLLDEEAARDR